MTPPTSTPLLASVRRPARARRRSRTRPRPRRVHRLQAVLDRLDEPLRVAIAGKVKAGKSTLLNALVGEELAPTDAGECTRIVTWYRDGITYRATLEPTQGEPRQVPFTRDGGAINDRPRRHRAPTTSTRLVIEWPSSSLRQMTLIDTPGIASLSTDVSARTNAFLTPGEDQVTPADAVLYLMRHLHASDINFLEAFHDEEFSQATPVNAVAVLSPGRRGGRRPHRLDGVGPAHRRPLPPRPQGPPAGPDRGARGRPAGPVGRHPARGRVQGARRHRLGATRRRRGPVPVGRPVRAGRDADPAHVDGARAPARPARPVRRPAGGGAHPPGRGRQRHRAVDRAGAAQRPRRAARRAAQPVRPAPRRAQGPLGAAGARGGAPRAPGARLRRAGHRARAHHRRRPRVRRRSACSTPCGPAA